MVEFNLLPDIKLEFLRTKRIEHLVITISFAVGGIAIAVFVLLFVYADILQKVDINHLNSDINQSTSTLKSNTNLNQILTVQNQLETIPRLEAQSPTSSRVFNYIAELTPVNATISDFNISFTANTVTITGGADTLATVNTFVDTLKVATYNNLTTHSTNQQAFNTVVLASFSYSNSQATSTGGSPAQYSITFNFDPTLFNSSDNIQLVVPSEVATQSILNQPTIFKAEPK